MEPGGRDRGEEGHRAWQISGRKGPPGLVEFGEERGSACLGGGGIEACVPAGSRGATGHRWEQRDGRRGATG
jgi:hypothetical protein